LLRAESVTLGASIRWSHFDSSRHFGPFHINPFKTWLVVAAVSTLSYRSYVLQNLTKGHGGVGLAAVPGGAYSTVTTIVRSRRAAREDRPRLFAGGILIASGMMYLRLMARLALCNRYWMVLLAPAFPILEGGAMAAGWFWTKGLGGFPFSHGTSLRHILIRDKDSMVKV
jgi:uncharacterized membrane protein (DUF4010 family)